MPGALKRESVNSPSSSGGSSNASSLDFLPIGPTNPLISYIPLFANLNVGWSEASCTDFSVINIENLKSICEERSLDQLLLTAASSATATLWSFHFGGRETTTSFNQIFILNSSRGNA